MPKQRVLEWLEKTGFPLEMEAASAFRTAGFDVRQSFTYLDPEMAKGREIDVLAQDPDLIGVVDIAFVVECKASANPWVVFTSDNAFENYNRLFAFAVSSGAARSALAKRVSTPLLERPTRGGYGLRQAFGKDSDPAYGAAISVLKACHGIAKDRVGSKIPLLAFAFPVIVVDSPLFECSRSPDGQLQLVEVDQSDFLFSAHMPEHIGCSIKVVTRLKLQDFAHSAKKLADALRKELKDEEENAFSLNNEGKNRA